MGFFGIGRDNKRIIKFPVVDKYCAVHFTKMVQEFSDDDLEHMGPCRDICFLCENTKTRKVIFEKYI